MLLDIIGACTWPAARDLRPLRNIFWANSFFWVFVHFSRGSSFWVFFCFLGFESKGISLIFCVFWKRFWKCGETLELLLILTIRSALSAPMFQRPTLKSRYFFCFCFFMTYIIFGFLDTLLDFLDIYAYTHTHTHTYIYIYMAWIKEGGNK